MEYNEIIIVQVDSEGSGGTQHFTQGDTTTTQVPNETAANTEAVDSGNNGGLLSGEEDQGNPWIMWVLLLGMVVFFYLFVYRPQKKRQKEHQNLLSSLNKGDKVMTNGGIYGIISSIKDDIVTIKISEEVKIDINKAYVANVVSKSSAE